MHLQVPQAAGQVKTLIVKTTFIPDMSIFVLQGKRLF